MAARKRAAASGGVETSEGAAHPILSLHFFASLETP